MRLETISNVDLIKYAYKGLLVARDDERDEVAIDEMSMQIEEIEDILESWRTRNMDKLMKRVKVPEQYGDWYYTENMDDDGERTYILYDCYSEVVNEFRNMYELKRYVRTGRKL